MMSSSSSAPKPRGSKYCVAGVPMTKLVVQIVNILTEYLYTRFPIKKNSGVARMQMLCGHNIGPRLNFSWRFFSYYMHACMLL